VGRRWPLEKTLWPIAEELSFINGEFMDGLHPSFLAVSGIKAEGDNESFAAPNSCGSLANQRVVYGNL
jgi:hypothetical protein